MSKCPFMTTDAGIPVADNQNSLTAGPRGGRVECCDKGSDECGLSKAIW